MSQNSNVIEVLNDLIEINNDRVVGYGKAAGETNDSDLQMLFNKLAGDSQNIAAELREEVNKLGGDAAEGTTTSGKLYRVWMDVKATFTSDDRKTALENSEFGEDAAQKAYEEALKSEDLTTDIRALISNQKVVLRTGHDTIKRHRDAARVTHA
jgi:uncharacterized protein (TIGR02284 family)